MTVKKSATQQDQKVRLAHVSIRNILGITELDFEPGSFTEVSGKNGQGKTSVLEAIKAALSGGHDATLLHNGAEKGEIVLVLSNGTEIVKRISADKSQSIVRAPGMTAAKPAEAIRALADILAVNPIEFLRSPRKERVNVLLEAMPMRADIQKLEELIGQDIDKYDVEGMLALDAIATLHKAIYDERTGTNRVLKEKQFTVKTLESSLPAVDESVQQCSIDQLKAQAESIHTERQAAYEKLHNDSASAAQSHYEESDKLRNEIATLEVKLQAVESKINTAKTKRNDDWRIIAAEFETKKLAIQNQITAAEQVEKQEALTQQTRDTIKKLEQEVTKLQTEAEDQCAILDNLDGYKGELLASLPIPGLEVKDGDIYHNGIVFDRLNSAQQVAIAVELAKLRSGKLGLICVDGIELLDNKTYAEFRKQALKSGLQLVVAKVSENPLKIQTEVKA